LSPYRRFEEFSIEANGGRTIDFILMGLKMAARDKCPSHLWQTSTSAC
jgi:hypothetical protein